MAHQLSVAARTAMAQAIETTIGTAPLLRVRTGAPPANCAASRTGTILAVATLPSDWMSASAGAISLLGTWQDASADAAGTAGHFEIMDSGGTTCHWQGTVTATSGGGDLELNNTSIASGQQVTITAWNITIANA